MPWRPILLQQYRDALESSGFEIKRIANLWPDKNIDFMEMDWYSILARMRA